MIIHVVKKGDSIYTIARRYGVSMQKIIADNRLENPGRLVVGQTIVIMTDRIPHVVSSGESLYTIARNYGTTVATLLSANPQITDPAFIYAGQVVTIPLPDEQLGSMLVNGYAFPNINRNTLRSTQAFLSYLSIFAYQVRPDGSLSAIPDQEVVNTARQAGVAPMMVITNIKEGASFNSDLAHTILTDQTVQNNLLDNVERTLKEKQYAGLDIDFEYVYPADRENYNQFLRKVAARLRPQGYTLTTALAPKLSGSQTGLLYQAHDYAAHGQIVDHVILMTYEWGYTYGPAQAVSPIDQVERVLQYAVSVIPSQKILMGMPNYGYDWTLPFVQGSAARTITNVEAVNLAARVGAEIQYDEKSQAPFFRYYDSSRRQHEVWFDDARSVEARLRLVKKYNLGGVSYWTINSYFPQNWLVLQSLYQVKKVL